MADPKITKMEVIEFEYFVDNMEGPAGSCCLDMRRELSSAKLLASS